jgi:uncharacterized protein YndB with AHSA1/START domain
MAGTHLRMHARAPRDLVWRALLDPADVQAWMVPDGMTSEIHRFEPREGGAFRISLTYLVPTGAGKTTAQTDTHHGRFTRLVPGERVEEVVEFETDDPGMQGEMRIRWQLSERDGGTDIEAWHDDLPPALSEDDNATGWRMSMQKLVALVEARQRAGG